jgi:hypothetical protein
LTLSHDKQKVVENDVAHLERLAKIEPPPAGMCDQSTCVSVMKSFDDVFVFFVCHDSDCYQCWSSECRHAATNNVVATPAKHSGTDNDDNDDDDDDDEGSYAKDPNDAQSDVQLLAKCTLVSPIDCDFRLSMLNHQLPVLLR